MNRRRVLETGLMNEFGHLETYDWLQGPVCPQGTWVVQRMQSQEEIQLLKFGAETAHQIWTGKPAMYARLQAVAIPGVAIEQLHFHRQTR